jgi:hypothetical protein
VISVESTLPVLLVALYFKMVEQTVNIAHVNCEQVSCRHSSPLMSLYPSSTVNVAAMEWKIDDGIF